MPNFCKQCNRPKGEPYHLFGICDTVRLTDGRTVRRERVEIGGDLHEEIHPHGLKVESRTITQEMRDYVNRRND